MNWTKAAAAAAILATAPACTKQQAKDASEILKGIALEICVEGESVEVCARKCAEFCEMPNWQKEREK